MSLSPVTKPPSANKATTNRRRSARERKLALLEDVFEFPFLTKCKLIERQFGFSIPLI